MAQDEQKHSGLDATLRGVKGMTKVLVLILIIVVLIVIGRESYKLGHDALYEVPVDEGEGREIEVTITEDMTVRDIGELLKDKGLLEESSTVFVLQERISEYHGELQPGTYTLTTGMTADEILRVMAGEDEDNQAEETTVSSSSAASDTASDASAADGA